MEAKFNGGDGLFIFVPGYSLAGLSPPQYHPWWVKIYDKFAKGEVVCQVNLLQKEEG